MLDQHNVVGYTEFVIELWFAMWGLGFLHILSTNVEIRFFFSLVSLISSVFLQCFGGIFWDKYIFLLNFDLKTMRLEYLLISSKPLIFG